MAWNGLVLTVDGRNALSKAQIDGTLRIKSIVVGDGNTPENFSTQKALVHMLYEIPEVSVSVTDTGCIVTGDFPTVDYDYYFREIGVMVSTDDGDKLYVYDNTGSDATHIVVSTGKENSQKRVRLSLFFSGVATVEATIENILYVDYQQFTQTIKELDSSKVSSAGGDLSDTIIGTLEESSEEFPVPAAGETSKIFFGKMRKFIQDFKNWCTGVLTIGMIVNNAVTDNSSLPVSAAVAMELQKQITQLYSDLDTRLIRGGTGWTAIQSIDPDDTNLRYRLQMNVGGNVSLYQSIDGGKSWNGKVIAHYNNL